MFDQYKDQYMRGELGFLNIAYYHPREACAVMHQCKAWDKEYARNDDQTKLRAMLLAASNCGHNLKHILENYSLPEYFWNGMTEGLCWEVQVGRMSENRAYMLGEQRAAREVISWMEMLIEYVGQPLPYWPDIDPLIEKLDEYDREHILMFVTEWINREWDIPDDDYDDEVVVLVSE